MIGILTFIVDHISGYGLFHLSQNAGSFFLQHFEHLDHDSGAGFGIVHRSVMIFQSDSQSITDQVQFVTFQLLQHSSCHIERVHLSVS